MPSATIIGILLGFLVVFEALPSLQATCPPGWLGFERSCYILLPQTMNWWQASELCDRPGGSLVIPNSQQEHDFLWREMKAWMKKYGANSKESQEIWIGCEDPHNDGSKLACSGMEGHPVFTTWGNHQPNAVLHFCVRMAETFGGKWGDDKCRLAKFAVCEMSESRLRKPYCLRADTSGRLTSPCQLGPDHVIKNLTITGVSGCGQACWAEPKCHSFNLLQSADMQQVVCQLNDVIYQDVSNLQRHQANDSHCMYFNL